MQLIVQKTQQPVTLVQYLSGRLPRVSRQSIHARLHRGDVSVNGIPVASDTLINQSDIISIHLPEQAVVLAEDISLTIVFENENLLVINKPAGMAMHKGLGVYNGTLLNAIAGHYQKTEQNNRLENGLVHRLDRQTTGLVVVAKNKPAKLQLEAQFATKQAKRIYTGFVWNHPGNGVLDKPIGRLPEQPHIIQVWPGGKIAVTHFTTLKQTALWSKMTWKLETGRTHQIRVHMHHLGCPVIADQRYRHNLLPEQLKQETQISAAIHGHLLQASSLYFYEPESGEQLSFSLPHTQCDIWEKLLEQEG